MRMVILQKNAENRARGKETEWSERLGERVNKGGREQGSEGANEFCVGNATYRTGMKQTGHG